MNNFRKFFAIVIVAIMLLVINSNVKAANKLAKDYSYAIEPQEELLLDLSSNSFIEKQKIIFINYLYRNDGVFIFIKNIMKREKHFVQRFLDQRHIQVLSVLQ